MSAQQSAHPTNSLHNLKNGLFGNNIPGKSQPALTSKIFKRSVSYPRMEHQRINSSRRMSFTIKSIFRAMHR